jgi:hypothetical protein
MTMTRRRALAPATFVLLLTWAPRDSVGDVIGVWDGVYSYSIEYLDFYGNPIGSSSGSGAATLTLDFGTYPAGPVAMYINEFGVGGPAFGSFGAQNANGTILIGGAGSYELGDFDVNFRSILPDGMTDTTGCSAVADYSASFYNIGFYGYVEEFAYFQSTQAVPEPSSIVVVATGAAALAVCALVLKLRRAPRRTRFAATDASL